MKIEELERPYEKKYNEMCEEFKGKILDMLETLHLDKRVVRVKDGVEGVLLTRQYYYWECFMKYKLDFFPITKSGEVSKKASGYVATWENLEEQFKPKEEA